LPIPKVNYLGVNFSHTAVVFVAGRFDHRDPVLLGRSFLIGVFSIRISQD